MNFQYTGPVFMGSASQQLKVIYDTGSDWLVLDTNLCQTCYAPVFDTSASTTYTQDSSQLLKQVYGSAEIDGYSATDSTALSSGTDTKLTSFNFFAITQ